MSTGVDRFWLIGFSGGHARVLRAALTLGLELCAFRIDFVCEMFSAHHAGDVEGERRMARRFDLRPDEPPCRALRNAFSRYIEAATVPRPPTSDTLDIQSCSELVPTATLAPGKWTSVRLTTAQLSSLRAACELFSRLAIGQGWAVPGYLGCPEHAVEAAHDFDRRFREIFFPELRQDAYYGINSQLVHDNARVAWDVQQVLRQHLAYDTLGMVAGRDKRDFRSMKGPEFDDPLQRSRLPLITCIPD